MKNKQDWRWQPKVEAEAIARVYAAIEAGPERDAAIAAIQVRSRPKTGRRTAGSMWERRLQHGW